MAHTHKSKTSTIIRFVLWASFILAMGASISHLAWAFGTLEFRDSQGIGILAALAVDAGLASLAYSIQQRRKAKRGASILWWGVGIFSLISAFANFLHAVGVESNGIVVLKTFQDIDALALVRALILSASLPLLVVYLGEIVSSDDVQAAKEADKEARKESTQESRDDTPDQPLLEPPKSQIDERIAVNGYDDFKEKVQSMNSHGPKSGSDVERTFKIAHNTAYRYWRRLQEENQ